MTGRPATYWFSREVVLAFAAANGQGTALGTMPRGGARFFRNSKKIIGGVFFVTSVENLISHWHMPIEAEDYRPRLHVLSLPSNAHTAQSTNIAHQL